MRKKLVLYTIFILFMFSSQSFANSDTNYSYKESIESWTIVLDLLLTIVAFELIPFILKIIKKRDYSPKEAKSLSILNSVVVQVIIAGIQIMLELNYENYKAKLNFMPAFFYGTINYYWLKSKIKNKNKDNNNEKHINIQNKKESLNSTLKKSEEKKEHDSNNTDIFNVKPIQAFEDFGEITIAPKSNYCSKCGKKVKEDWFFCNNCGNKIK